MTAVRTEREQAAYDRAYRIARPFGYVLAIMAATIGVGMAAHVCWGLVNFGWRLG